MTRLAALAVAALAVLLVSTNDRQSVGLAGAHTSEVVVLLESPALAVSPESGVALDAEQRVFRRELADRVPAAEIGWRYRLVANGFSISLPSSQLPRLRALPGVRDVFATTTYGPQLDRTPQQIGASALWGPTLDTAGQGMKIGIIDSGVDPSHPFFDPAGYAMPPGFPKGQVQHTTSKVIVARAFAPRGAPASARIAVHPSDNSHGTHVAGIAAGNAQTSAGTGRVVSGVAPRAYIGNYKVFVETRSGLSPNANSPAIVAAIEAAVADGMDVINFSGGEPEIEPSRDIVALALDAAAAAGVVPVVAAGNDFNDVGAGSVSSPANSEQAIAVGAVDISGSPATRIHAGFSSVGPTTISLRLKPDVAAPGVEVLSSVPGGWDSFSGTSMAAPHVAGAAALLAQRHADWTVAQIKSALIQTGSDVVDEDDTILGPPFQGGGTVALGRADRPLLFAGPSSISFGLLGRGERRTGSLALEDAGGGDGVWEMLNVVRGAPKGARLALPATVTVPGSLDYEVVVSPTAAQGELSGYVELRRNADVRRIPYWGRVAAPALAQHAPVRAIPRVGIHKATTAGRPVRVSRYRYPEDPRGIGVTTVLRGPELVYLVGIGKGIANFGVVVTQRAPGSQVEPRVVAGLNENRLTGYAGLPVNHNPYMDDFREPVLAAGALSPAPGEYAIVFDSATVAGAGRFMFRFWVNDVTPPTVRLRSRTVPSGAPVLVAASDAGSGLYRASINASVDGDRVSASFRKGVISIPTRGLARGTHRLHLSVSDIQETKNTENVARILPNTRTLAVTFRVR